MSPATSILFLRRSAHAAQPRSPGCNTPRTPAPPPKLTSAVLGIVFAVVCHAWVSTAVGASHDGSKPMASGADVTQSEIDRLMAIARETRDGKSSMTGHLTIDGRPSIGAEEAPVILVEVASFECPFCRRHWLDTMPVLRQRFIESGQLRYVFVDVVLDPRQEHAHAATEAAHCAREQGLYAAFRDHIYSNQKAIAAAFLESHAQAIGLDLPEFRQCMGSDRHKAQIESDTALARKLRVRGTPSFFWALAEPDGTNARLIRRVSGIQAIDAFARQFDVLRTRKQAAAAAVADGHR